MEDLRYPIGRFTFNGKLSDVQIHNAIEDINTAPAALHNAVQFLTNTQLDTPYRPQGWTLRQVVHHLADSHINAYVRLKLTLTEKEPTIRSYDEVQWANLPDATGPIDMSVNLIKTLHLRWVFLLKKLGPKDWKRKLIHPQLGSMDVDELVAHYSWHGRHHIAHITSLHKRMGW